MSPLSNRAGPSALTVDAAMRLPAMRCGMPEVLASKRHLDRPVRWVHAGEVPNMASLLRGGELLLTTGMGLQGGEPAQRRFIAELAERQVAALAIELGSTFQTVPDPLVSEADANGLPLIALHREVPFVEITEALHREIVNRQFVVMRRSDELHRRFTELVLEGAGIPEVLAALAEAIANPVVLDKDAHGVLYHAANRSSSNNVLACWEDRSQPSSPERFVVAVPAAGHQRWGRLGALALDSPLDDVDRVAIERSVELIALALLRNRQEEVLAVRERGNFLAELMAGELTEREAAMRAGELGFAAHVSLLLPIAVMRAPTVAATPPGQDDLAWALVWRDVRRELRSLDIPVLIGTIARAQVTLLVLGIAEEEDRRDLAGRVAALIQDAATRHVRSREAAIVSVEAVVAGWGPASERLEAAIASAEAAASGPRQAWHDSTRADLHRLLWLLREHDGLREFVVQRLAPLVAHDRDRSAKLLPTLEAYCMHGGRKAETARALHLERQSLYHRLERIERILGENLSDDDTVLALHLALRAREYVIGAGTWPAAHESPGRSA
jgi:PucR family transcriptional regulator, purine catabolism regulatory protein